MVRLARLREFCAGALLCFNVGAGNHIGGGEAVAEFDGVGEFACGNPVVKGPERYVELVCGLLRGEDNGVFGHGEVMLPCGRSLVNRQISILASDVRPSAVDAAFFAAPSWASAVGVRGAGVRVAGVSGKGRAVMGTCILRTGETVMLAFDSFTILAFELVTEGLFNCAGRIPHPAPTGCLHSLRLWASVV